MAKVIKSIYNIAFLKSIVKFADKNIYILDLGFYGGCISDSVYFHILALFSSYSCLSRLLV